MLKKTLLKNTREFYEKNLPENLLLLKKSNKKKKIVVSLKGKLVKNKLLRFKAGKRNVHTSSIKKNLQSSSLNQVSQKFSLFSIHALKSEFEKKQTRSSDFKNSLKEKKKLSILYGNLSNKEIKKTLQKAYKLDGSTKENLFLLLESRLDIILYRALFFPSIKFARHWIKTKKILVNSQYITIPSYKARFSDVISVTSKNKRFIGNTILKFLNYYNFTSNSNLGNQDTMIQPWTGYTNKNQNNIAKKIRKITKKVSSQKKNHITWSFFSNFLFFHLPFCLATPFALKSKEKSKTTKKNISSTFFFYFNFHAIASFFQGYFRPLLYCFAFFRCVAMQQAERKNIPLAGARACKDGFSAKEKSYFNSKPNVFSTHHENKNTTVTKPMGYTYLETTPKFLSFFKYKNSQILYNSIGEFTKKKPVCFLPTNNEKNKLNSYFGFDNFFRLLCDFTTENFNFKKLAGNFPCKNLPKFVDDKEKINAFISFFLCFAFFPCVARQHGNGKKTFWLFAKQSNGEIAGKSFFGSLALQDKMKKLGFFLGSFLLRKSEVFSFCLANQNNQKMPAKLNKNFLHLCVAKQRENFPCKNMFREKHRYVISNFYFNQLENQIKPVNTFFTEQGVNKFKQKLLENKHTFFTSEKNKHSPCFARQKEKRLAEARPCETYFNNYLTNKKLSYLNTLMYKKSCVYLVKIHKNIVDQTEKIGSFIRNNNLIYGKQTQIFIHALKKFSSVKHYDMLIFLKLKSVFFKKKQYGNTSTYKHYSYNDLSQTQLKTNNFGRDEPKKKQSFFEPRGFLRKKIHFKPLHLEISYKTLTIIYLYPPQKLVFPCTLDIELLVKKKSNI